MTCVPSGIVSSRRVLVLAVGALAALAVSALRARSSSGSAPAATAAAPDFARAVAPIVRETCLGCHRDGGIAPFAFRTERDLASRASLIVAALEEGRMPPWPPSARSPAYLGQAARTLDRRERETLVRWARSQLVRPGPARRGTPLAPKPTPERTHAGETHREVAMPAAYRPRG